MQPEQDCLIQWEIPPLEWSALERCTVLAAVAVSSSGRLMGANGRFAKLLHVGSAGDLVGRSMADLLVDAKEWWRIADRMHGAQAGPINVRLRRSDGETVALRGDVHVVPDDGGRHWLLGLLMDTTDEQQLRYAMQRSARLEALGSLMSGVAHDFDNLVTELLNNVLLLAEGLRDQPDQFEKLEAARDAAACGAELFHQLLAFARPQPIEAELVDAIEIVENLAPLIDRALGSKITLEIGLAAGIGPIRGNAAQLESALVNLVINARDATTAEGKVVIAVRARRLDARGAQKYELTPGHYVEIRVTDEGVGIPKETIARVFEPFFSTKGESKGTGLGLSMVRSYAAQFGGVARIESDVGRGTSVSLIFPCCGASSRRDRREGDVTADTTFYR